ncbi:MAG: hypothetical protein ABFD18_14920 [Syntrophomonas sp.]
MKEAAGLQIPAMVLSDHNKVCAAVKFAKEAEAGEWVCFAGRLTGQLDKMRGF